MLLDSLLSKTFPPESTNPSVAPPFARKRYATDSAVDSGSIGNLFQTRSAHPVEVNLSKSTALHALKGGTWDPRARRQSPSKPIRSSATDPTLCDGMVEAIIANDFRAVPWQLPSDHLAWIRDISRHPFAP